MDLANSVATKEHNQLRNRYCNVIPFDHNRVKLSSSKNDYINASHMPYELTGKHYIFTQGPLESTSSDFWQMVYEQESNIIVMLTDVIESGHCK
jgi:protein tyrosine phosphatase